jgi:hypothetical protein
LHAELPLCSLDNAARVGQSALVIAGPNGYPVPLWVFWAFVAFAAIYVVVNEIRDARRRSKSRADRPDRD